MQMHLSTIMGCYSSTHLTRISTPRFLGKKRGKGLQLSSTIFRSSRWSSFLKERGNNSGKMDFWEDQVSHGQLMEWVFVNISWTINMKHMKVWEGMEKFQIWFAKSWVHLSDTRKPSKREALDVQYGCRKRRLNSSLLFLLKTWFLVSI
jgi:hypothetical protein